MIVRRYVKLDNRKIIDIFHEGQKNKFDGTEVFLDNAEPSDVWINGKGIFNEAGKPAFRLKNDGTIEEISNDTDVLQYWKDRRDKEIREDFEKEIAEGSFVSTTLGIEVDARRSGTKNDLQNVLELIKRMTADAQASTTYVGKSENAPATVAQLEALALEMVRHPEALYAKKWQKQAAIQASATKQEVKTIKWKD